MTGLCPLLWPHTLQWQSSVVRLLFFIQFFPFFSYYWILPWTNATSYLSLLRIMSFIIESRTISKKLPHIIAIVTGDTHQHNKALKPPTPKDVKERGNLHLIAPWTRAFPFQYKLRLFYFSFFLSWSKFDPESIMSRFWVDPKSIMSWFRFNPGRIPESIPSLS